MHNLNSYDPSEFRATLDELQDRNYSAPQKIPAGIAKPPRRKRNWWESKNDRRKFGDLDSRFARAATRRCQQSLLAEEIYGGEDEMIEAIDETRRVLNENLRADFEDLENASDAAGEEPLHRTRIKRVSKIRYGTVLTRVGALYGAIVETTEKVVEHHDPLPPPDVEERAEARKLSREAKRETNARLYAKFQPKGMPGPRNRKGHPSGKSTLLRIAHKYKKTLGQFRRTYPCGAVDQTA